MMETSGPPDFVGNARYRVLRQLGAGGMGVVYEAVDIERGHQRLALKRLRHHDGPSLLRLKREFRSLADLHHPNLVALYDLVAHDGGWFITLELVEGIDFLSWVRPGERRPSPRDLPTAALDITAPSPVGLPPLDGDRLRRALRQLVTGVAALHAGGRLHRDLKPSNVLVMPTGAVKILDYGLVAELQGDGTAFESQSHEIVGTAAYMAPEQADGRACTAAVDWYALGVMLFQALAGRLPFDGAPVQVLLDKQKTPAPLLRDFAKDVPADLHELAMRLLERDPLQRPTIDEIQKLLGLRPAEAPLPPKTETGGPFVGRAAELALLRDDLASARAGAARVVKVLGASGIGKTTLVKRFAQQAAAEGAVVLAGRCYERENVPFKALDSVIESLARYLAAHPERADAVAPRDAQVLVRMFPVLGRVPSFAAAPAREVKEVAEQRRRATAALRELLGRMTDRVCLVVVVDDAQWGDHDSAALLEDLLRPDDPPPVLWVLTARTGFYLRPMPVEVRTIELAPLRQKEAEVLVQAAHLQGERLATVVKEAAGNPFLLHELTRVAETGAHTSLDTVVRQRLSGLSDRARRVLEVVAVAGQPIDQLVAARVAELPTSEWHVLLGLKAANLLKALAGDESERIEPWHDRIREAVVAGLDEGAQQAIHARIADELKRSSPQSLDAIAFHLEAAARAAEAGEALIAAAARAANKFAFEHASQLYRRGLKELAPNDPRRRELVTRLADALAAAGQGLAAAQAYQAAQGEHAAQALTPEQALDLKRHAAEQLLRSGHIDEGLQAIADVLGQVGMTLAKAPWRALGALLVRRAHLSLRGLEFRERPAAEVKPQLLQHIDVCWSVSVGLAMVDTIRGASFQTRQLLLALEAGEPYRVARALAAEAAFVATSGGAAENKARRLIAEARRLTERVGDGQLHGLVDFCAGLTRFLVGRWSEARTLSSQAERWFREQGTVVTWEAANARLFSLWSHFYLGDLAELSKLVPALQQEAATRGDRYAMTSLQIGLANVTVLAADDPEGARARVRDAMAQWPQHTFHFQHYWALLSECMIDLYQGNHEAFGRLETAWPRLKRSMLLRIQNVRVEARYLRARCAVVMGRTGEAIADAQRLESEGASWAAALGSLIRGLASEQPEQRKEHLGRAVALLDENEMALFAAAARMRLGELEGGALGQARVKAGTAWMLAQGVKNPDAMCRMLAPTRSS